MIDVSLFRAHGGSHLRRVVAAQDLMRHAAIFFRGIKCLDKRQDRVADCVALGWKWYIRLCERGKDVMQLPATFASLVARAVKCGRRVCRQEHINDAMNLQAHQRHGFIVESLPTSTATPHESCTASPSASSSRMSSGSQTRGQHDDTATRQASVPARFPGLAPDLGSPPSSHHGRDDVRGRRAPGTLPTASS